MKLKQITTTDLSHYGGDPIIPKGDVIPIESRIKFKVEGDSYIEVDFKDGQLRVHGCSNGAKYTDQLVIEPHCSNGFSIALKERHDAS